jgi:SAM-dependent methyltransferase
VTVDAAAHPARYTPALLDVIADRLTGCRLILDPFAGTGERLALIAERSGSVAVGVEITAVFIERPDIVAAGDATCLPFADGTFDGGCSSPTYGNGMNDSFVSSAWETSRRHTYSHAMRARIGDREARLPARSTARWHFDTDAYRDLHVAAWGEVARVLRPGAPFVLNTKNSADRRRSGRVASSPVTAWHRAVLRSVGFDEVDRIEVTAAGLRHGANRDRVPVEDLTVFRRAL